MAVSHGCLPCDQASLRCPTQTAISSKGMAHHWVATARITVSRYLKKSNLGNQIFLNIKSIIGGSSTRTAQEAEAPVCWSDGLSSILDPTRLLSSDPHILALAHLSLNAHVHTQTHTILLNLNTLGFQVTYHQYIAKKEHCYVFPFFFSCCIDLIL